MDDKPPEKTTPDTPEPQKPIRRSFNFGCFTWLSIILAIYLLSVGPAFRLAMKGNAPKPVADWVGIIYTPLFGLSRLLPPFGDFLFWYLGIWGWRPAFA